MASTVLEIGTAAKYKIARTIWTELTGSLYLRLICCSIFSILVVLLFAVSARAQTNPVPVPNAQQVFAAEIAQFVEADRSAPPAFCQILFVGSSSIVKWREHLAADMTPMAVINRGFGGAQIEDVNRWFNQIVAPYRPHAIVFYAGENDIDAGKSVDRVLKDFEEFMRRKTQELGKTPVYFISIKPSKLRFSEFSLQSQLNAAIRERADQGSDLHYIDVVSPMLKNGKPKDIFVADGLHMSQAGYVIWTRAVRRALLPNVESEVHSCRLAVAHSSAPKRKSRP